MFATKTTEAQSPAPAGPGGRRPADRDAEHDSLRAVPWLPRDLTSIPPFPPQPPGGHGPAAVGGPARTSELPGAAPLTAGFIQRKLPVGASGEPLEQEADRVAGQLMRMAVPDAAVTSAGPQLSRACACGGGEGSGGGGGGACACDEKDGVLQPKHATAASGPQEAPDIVHDVLRTPGAPLDAASRAFFEPRLGYDLSAVRVHAGPLAAQSARQVGALAYTVGGDIVLGAGRPGAQAGPSALIAHELVHTVQQGAVTRLGAAPRPPLAASASSPPAAPRVQRQDDHQPPDPYKGGVPVHDGTSMHEVTPCRETARLTSPEHQLIQSDYQTKINQNSAREYAIPESAEDGRTQGYADLVDLTSYAIYDIKNPSDDLGKAKAQVLRYLTKAREHCDPAAPWHAGDKYPSPRTVRSIEPGTDLVVDQIFPGILQYTKRSRAEQGERPGTPPVVLQELLKIADAGDRLRNKVNLSAGEHRAELDIIDKPSVAGFAGFVSGKLSGIPTPPILIWNNAFGALAALTGALRRHDVIGAIAAFARAHKAYVQALRQYVTWKDGVTAAAEQIKTTATYTAVAAAGILAIGGAIIAAPAIAEALGIGAVAEGAAGAGATAETAAATEAVAVRSGQALIRIGQIIESGELGEAAEAARATEMEELIDELRTMRAF
jgi:hypothetical protein